VEKDINLTQVQNLASTVMDMFVNVSSQAHKKQESLENKWWIRNQFPCSIYKKLDQVSALAFH